ncbi:MAG TPA: hypothetical protein VER36_11660 [Flavisolibacter sp.]|nr:hypothetical protein [Flavisolibacter sp.]
MANERESDYQPQQGTGSAENTDRDRTEQMNELTELSLEERMSVADKIGVPPEQVADVRDTGMLSGRDDLSGGSGDRMEDQNTGEETDR